MSSPAAPEAPAAPIDPPPGAAEPSVEDLSDYRKHLQSAEQKSQEDFDKTVLSLSGGALGISFVFLKDVIGPNPVDSPGLLFAAWVAWGLSTSCVLASYYFSHLALRKTIRQVDTGTIRKELAGGLARRITVWLNAIGALLFLVGVVSITMFASVNMKTKGGPENANKPATVCPAAPSCPAPAPAPPPGGTAAASSAAAR